MPVQPVKKAPAPAPKPVAKAPAPAPKTAAPAPKPTPAPKAEAQAKELGTKEVAALYNVKPAFLRRVLRSLAQFSDGTYTRYKWPEGDPFIEELSGHIEKFKVVEKERNAKRLAALKDKTAKAKKKTNGAEATTSAADEGLEEAGEEETAANGDEEGVEEIA